MKVIKKSRLLLLSAWLCTIVSGCGDEKPEAEKVPGALRHAPSNVSSEIAGKDSVKSFLSGMKAYSKGDLAELVPLLPDEVEWVNMTSNHRVIKGRVDLAKNLMAERNVFPDCKLAIRRLASAGGKILAEGVYHGTHGGPVFGIAPTGKQVSYNMVYFVEMKGGAIMRNVAYFNPVSPLRQIGGVAAAAAGPPPLPPQQPKIVEQPKDGAAEKVVDTFYKSLTSGEMTRLTEIVAEDAVWRDMALQKETKGRTAFLAELKKTRAEYDGLRFKVEDVIGAGGIFGVRVVRHGTYSTLSKDGKKTSRPVEIPEAHVFEIRDGRIASLNLYYDEMTLFKQFGLTAQTAIGYLNKRAEHARESLDAGVDASAKAQAGTPKVQVEVESASDRPPRAGGDPEGPGRN